MRNLLGRLLERTPDELERIAQFWAVELRGRDRHGDVSMLYRTMTDIWTARDAWEQLPAASRALVRAFHAREGAVLTPADLAAASGVPLDLAREELTRLYDAGIVTVADEQPRDPDALGTDPALFVPREIDMILARVDAEMDAGSPFDESLESLLARVPYPELEEAAIAWGARVIPAMHARGELVGIIREQLARRERVDRQVGALSEPARNTWARLKAAGGVLPLDDLLAPRDVPLAARRRILRELSQPLLLWHSYGPSEPAAGARVRLAVAPRAILAPPPPAAAPAPALLAVDAEDVVEPEWVFPYAAAWDLLTLLRDVAHGAPRWRALVEGDPALTRRLAGRLWRADRETRDLPAGYLTFLARVGARCGVLRERDDRAAPGDEAGSWREHAFTTAQARMVSAWIAAEEWIEGRERIDASVYGASWPVLRGALLKALGELEEERWTDERSFVERLLAAQPNLLQQAQAGAVVGRRARALDSSARGHDRRVDLLTLVLATTLETACVWLGLIERARVRGGVAVVRVTPFARWLAGKRVEPAIAPLGNAALAVGANFQVLLYRPTPRRVWALSAFAELTALDRVSTYTLTAEALIRGLAHNLDLAQITGFLERANGAPLPQNVLYTLAEWDRGYRRVWLRRAVVLVPEEGEKSEPIVAALKEAGLEPELLPDGRLALLHDEVDAGERLYAAAHRALRERGFAPLADPGALRRRKPA